MLRKILLREGASGMTRRGFLGGGCAAAVLAPGFAHAGMAPGAPANVGEINNSCFIKAVTGGVMSTLYRGVSIV